MGNGGSVSGGGGVCGGGGVPLVCSGPSRVNDVERGRGTADSGEPLDEEEPGPPFEERPEEPVGQLRPVPSDVMGEDPPPPELQQYAERVGRRNAVSAPTFDMNEALSYVPIALGKRENEFSVIHRVFTENPLFSSLEPEILRVLINAMERAELLPGAIICQPRKVNQDFFIICRGTVFFSPNPYYDQTSEGQTTAPQSGGIRSLIQTRNADAGDGLYPVMGQENAMNVDNGPGVALFSTNLLYPSLPSHIVRAGENGATAYRLGMECFKNVVAKMNRYVDRRQVTFLGITIQSDNSSGNSCEDDDSESSKTPSAAQENSDMPSEEFVVAHPAQANVPLSLFPVAAAGLAAPFQPGENMVWDQTQTALLTYVFPIERRVAWNDSRVGHGDEMSSGESRYAFLGARRRWRRHAVVGESVRVDDQFRPTSFDKTAEQYESLLRIVESIPILSILTAQRKKHVVDSFERRVVPAGCEASHEFHWIESGTMLRDTTVTQCPASHEQFVIPGYADSAMFSVSNSKALSSTTGSGGSQNATVARTLGPGECFGHEWLLYMYNERMDFDPPMCAAPEEDAVLWTIRRSTLRRIFVADALRKLWKRFCLIRSMPAFAPLNRAQCMHVANALVPVRHAPGAALLRAGMDPADIVLIDRGTVEATARGEQQAKGVAVHAQFVGHAQCVGAAEVLGGGESPFDYRTCSEVSAYRLSRFALPRMFTAPVNSRISHIGGAAERRKQRAQVDLLLQEQEDARDADSDTDSEQAFMDDMCPVELKDPEDDAFLHEFFSKRREYAETPSMYRGLAVAAFSARHIVPRGTRLFEEVCEKESDKDEKDKNDPEARCGNVFENEDCLFVIREGAVVVTSGGEHVAHFGRGFSVGEERLMRSRRARSFLTATVTTDTCAVHCLDRKSFRRLLMPAFLAYTRSLRRILTAMPFSLRFSSAALIALGRRAPEVWLEPAAVLLTRGCEPRGVFALLDGTVNITRVGEANVCATLGPGDIVGGIDIMRQQSSVASYAARSRVRALFIPIDVFMDSFLRFDDAAAYLQELLQTRRYAFFEEGQADSKEMEEDMPIELMCAGAAGAPWGAASCIRGS